MRVLEQTVSCLGEPTWIQSPSGPLGSQILMARWRHNDARVVISTSDMIRVVVNLASGPLVQHSEREESVTVRSLPGNLSVMLPHVPSETVIAGQADVLQIFIRPELLRQPICSALAKAPQSEVYDQLKRTVMRFLVAARQADARRPGTSQDQYANKICCLLSSNAFRIQDGLNSSSGPGALRLADRFISKSIDQTASAKLPAMASAAGLSVTHLIRTFRRERGTTPHQILIMRRLQRAMDLLLMPHLSVAEIADSTGFSSPAHFVATFHARTGVSPGAYQRALER